MKLASCLTISIVSHGHGGLVENLVQQLDSNPSLEGVKLVVTLNKTGELFSYESTKPHRLQLTIIRNSTSLGFGANHNQAFKECNTPWFAILNPDLSIPNDIFKAMIKTANDFDASLTVPRVVNSLGTLEDSIRWNLTPWSLMKRWLRIAGENRFKDNEFRWFAGMFYIVKSTDFRDICGFDERFFLYCEDYDLCARMHLAGKTLLFQPNINVIHDARRSSWVSRKYLVMHLKSMCRVWFSTIVWRIAFKGFFDSRKLLKTS